MFKNENDRFISMKNRLDSAECISNMRFVEFSARLGAIGTHVEQSGDENRQIEKRMTEMGSQMCDIAKTFHNRINVVETKFETLCDHVTQLGALVKALSHKK
jgi:hypothetical protein